MDEINPPNPLADAQDVGAADGAGNDSEVVNIKDLLGEELGRNFDSDEAALKSIKETYNYVGKVGKFAPILEQLQAQHGGEAAVIKLMEDLTKQPDASQQVPDPAKFVSREQYDNDAFFSKNPQHAANREIIEALRLKENKPLNEIVELPVYKTIFEKAAAHDATEGSKSVLQTSPRLAQVKDKVSTARDQLKAGDYLGAKANAVGAVIEAFEPK